MKLIVDPSINPYSELHLFIAEVLGGVLDLNITGSTMIFHTNFTLVTSFFHCMKGLDILKSRNEVHPGCTVGCTSHILDVD